MPDDSAWTAVDVRADEAGILVIGAAAHLLVTEGEALIPWDQAVAVARRIIELARACGDLT